MFIILIKPLNTKAHDRRASGDCGTSGLDEAFTYYSSITQMVYIYLLSIYAKVHDLVGFILDLYVRI